MNGMALANPVGLQLDFLLKTFGLRFLAGLFLLLSVYGFFTMKYIQKSTKIRAKIDHQTDTLHRQLRIKKMQEANDQELLTLFVAYLEKFHTKTGAHSFTSLLAGAKFSDNEITELKVVNYGKGRLSAQLKEKIMKRINNE